MTEEQVKKLRDEIRPKDLHFQCGDTVCAAHGSWEKGFDAAYDLQAKRIAELESKEAALLKSFQDQVNAGADFYLATVKRLEKEKAELVAKRAQELKERDALKARVAELEAAIKTLGNSPIELFPSELERWSAEALAKAAQEGE